MACSSEEPTPVDPAKIDNIIVAPETSQDVSTVYTYFLMPSQQLLDAEYDNLRNNLENLGTPETRLRQRAFEGAVGMIASMLDAKYGNHVQGEVLPSSRVIIVKADQELDLSLLKGLIIDLDGESD